MADLVASMVLLVVAFHAVPLMVKEPVETALTTKELIVPSMSASLPAVCRSLNEMVAAAFLVEDFTEDKNAVRVGASLIALTSTLACTAVADAAPELSVATAVKALSVPLALAAGVQNADLVASMVWLVVAFQAVAEPGLMPIFKVPLDTALTAKAVTEPSTSASLPAASKSLSKIVASASSLLVLTEVTKEVRVGMVLPPITETTA